MKINFSFNYCSSEVQKSCLYESHLFTLKGFAQVRFHELAGEISYNFSLEKKLIEQTGHSGTQRANFAIGVGTSLLRYKCPFVPFKGLFLNAKKL